ncbi:MAG: undecaprenyl-diphosphate phosphatase [Bacteroidota bacterium]
MSIIEAVIIAIVEGLTEYLPVSSTGHMIITTAILGIEPDDFIKFFTVNIQLGAILAVVVLYFKRFFKSFDFYFKLIVAFIPAAVLGILFSDKIDELLESPATVAITLLLGGIILLFVDKWFAANDSEGVEEVTYKNAFIIGCFQCISMIPGVSRSASTIIGGLTQKLTRKAAAEFSFFLAVPTMFGATAKKSLDLYQDKGLDFFTSERLMLLCIGNVVAFIVALVAIKAFITFLTKNGFKVFGWYRIIVGGIILILLGAGYSLSVV